MSLRRNRHLGIAAKERKDRKKRFQVRRQRSRASRVIKSGENARPVVRWACGETVRFGGPGSSKGSVPEGPNENSPRFSTVGWVAQKTDSPGGAAEPVDNHLLSAVPPGLASIGWP
jgi:hypothetical protein